MASSVYETRDGDSIDWLAWRYYGTAEASAVEQLLEANPGLADYGPELPAGLQVTLPEFTAPAKVSGVRLWD